MKNQKILGKLNETLNTFTSFNRLINNFMLLKEKYNSFREVNQACDEWVEKVELLK